VGSLVLLDDNIAKDIHEHHVHRIQFVIGNTGHIEGSTILSYFSESGTIKDTEWVTEYQAFFQKKILDKMDFFLYNINIAIIVPFFTGYFLSNYFHSFAGVTVCDVSEKCWVAFLRRSDIQTVGAIKAIQS
jgi:hypothetical protein